MRSVDTHAEIVTLHDFAKRAVRIRIPLYQRLYVWREEQVDRLMDDLISAWQEGKSAYYLGGILAIARTDPGSGRTELELIDGQQRLTTLWLLALAWLDQGGGSELASFASIDGEPRIYFEVREPVNEFFKNALLTNQIESSTETAALEMILERLARYPEFSLSRTEAKTLPDRQSLARYVNENVKLALTVVPPSTDLNKLFEVINNRGEQLQHHDILKSLLLKEIPDPSERTAYARLWDACAALDQYVERNLPSTLGSSITSFFADWYDFSPPGSLGKTKDLVDRLQRQETASESRPLRIDEILQSDKTNEEHAPSGADTGDDDSSVQSIISFPMLLQHCLRLYRYKAGLADMEHIRESDLLSIFQQFFLKEPGPRQPHVKAFIKLLWEVRVAFDCYVVKWVERDEQDRQLDVRQIRKSTEGITRTADGVPKELCLLQAVIYHSLGKTTHYWLTPFLDWALENPSYQDAWQYLEYLEQCLFTQGIADTQREATLKMLRERWSTPIHEEVPTELTRKGGDDYHIPHYWFYKTEYVLWKWLRRQDSQLAGFRITAKNSIEHISPQKPIDEDGKGAGDLLHAFANLALISHEENSRFGHDIFQQKRSKYRQVRRDTPSSLKLDLIYSRHDTWRRVDVEDHERDIVRSWERYLAPLQRLARDKTQSIA
ncbi:DUF262 domain-containing HNH endonuclease family protein [Guyparkeria hydrothermalis]|uniref:DUF262 domain-containing protein n=1 Tax=Guyparkeria hydrothermalis TaxID=923 RepID=UPI0020226230|nr:DUF262 domain-containing protein [Guyparkeria hydrothermalis]MCL7744253.1 DUF262 domain-containing HNH endonuclease family protein [Guyparkeria hydrothermalis]